MTRRGVARSVRPTLTWASRLRCPPTGLRRRRVRRSGVPVGGGLAGPSRDARPGLCQAARLWHGSTVRPLDHSPSSLGRRPLRKLDARSRRAASRRVPARLCGCGADACRGGRDRRAGSSFGARTRRGVHERGHAPARGWARHRPLGLGEATAARGRAPTFLSGLGRRPMVGRARAEEAIALMRAQNEPAETAVRVNRRRRARRSELQLDAGAGSHPLTQIPIYRCPRRRPVPPDWLDARLVWPQSRGSQLAGLAVGASPGERILDLCAAPGGKATQLDGEVDAVELNEGRARELREVCGRLRATTWTVVCADGLALPAELRDSIGRSSTLPAPDSGRSPLGRTSLAGRAASGAATRRSSAPPPRACPSGGALVYSVCTINRAENEAVVDALGLPTDDLGAEWPRFRHPAPARVPPDPAPSRSHVGLLRRANEVP